MARFPTEQGRLSLGVQACFPWCDDDDRVYPLSLKGDSCFTTSILWSPHFLGWAWTLSVSLLGVASSVLSLGSLPAAQTRAQRVCEWAPKRGEPPRLQRGPPRLHLPREHFLFSYLLDFLFFSASLSLSRTSTQVAGEGGERAPNSKGKWKQPAVGTTGSNFKVYFKSPRAATGDFHEH